MPARIVILSGAAGVGKTSLSKLLAEKSTYECAVRLQYDDFNDYIYGRTDKPQGMNYEFVPKVIEDSAEMRQFIDMCFDPKSPMNDRLRRTLIEMVSEVKE